MRKGFTFGQIATLLLVVLGLVMSVIVVSTQLRSSSSSLSEISDQTTSGTSTAIKSLTGFSCELAGAICEDTCGGSRTSTKYENSDCPTPQGSTTQQLCCI